MEDREYESIRDRVRRLRNEMTHHERKMWIILKNRNLLGYKFRRQHPIIAEISESGHKSYYIIDFYCSELRFGIEVDGGIHREQKAYDNHRDRLLESLGITIIRILNEELDDPEIVRQKLVEMIEHRFLPP